MSELFIYIVIIFSIGFIFQAGVDVAKIIGLVVRYKIKLKALTKHEIEVD